MQRMQSNAASCAAMSAVWLALTAGAGATYHFMQIEEVIGGVNGNTTVQAVQLRMRSLLPQNEVMGKIVKVYDAAGQNPVELITFPSDVPFGGLGRNILIATANFAAHTDNPTASPDFIMTNPIPASYLAAGSLTFEDPVPQPRGEGGILWRLSWGGAGYTGDCMGLTINDADGNFCPPFPGACPSATLQALRFTGSASALSTTNMANYAITAGAATFRNNANVLFNIVATPALIGDLNNDAHVNGLDIGILLSQWGTAGSADLNGSGVVDGLDIGVMLANWTG